MKKRRVAFLGPEGTVSEQAARFFFKEDAVSFIPYKLISDVFQATDTGDTEFSIIPIENTIDGSVSLHMDWLVHEVNLPIQAEWIYPSVQNLIGIDKKAADDFSTIKKVFSHPVAMAQCKEFIQKHLPHAELDHVSSTAKGVRIVKESGRTDWAAVGTELAANRYGLEILAANVQDHQNNFTRFIAIGHESVIIDESMKSAPRKTSIIVTLPEDYAGALHQVLSAFAWRRLNLSRIESRPTKKQLGNYYFYIDIVNGIENVLLTSALQEIEAIGCQVRILGSYPSFGYDKSFGGVQ